MMYRRPSVNLAVHSTLLLLVACSVVRAGEFTVSLEVSDGTHKQTVNNDSTSGKVAAPMTRPTMEALAGARFSAKFKLTNRTKDSIKDALVHFYVVKIDKAGAAPPPLEPRLVAIESAQTLDFAPGGSTSAELQFKADDAGVYLVRIETSGSDPTHSRADFSSLDLIVK